MPANTENHLTHTSENHLTHISHKSRSPSSLLEIGVTTLRQRHPLFHLLNTGYETGNSTGLLKTLYFTERRAVGPVSGKLGMEYPPSLTDEIGMHQLFHCREARLFGFPGS